MSSPRGGSFFEDPRSVRIALPSTRERALQSQIPGWRSPLTLALDEVDADFDGLLGPEQPYVTFVEKT